MNSQDKLVKKIQTKAYHLEFPLLKGEDSMKPNEYKLLAHMRKWLLEIADEVNDLRCEDEEIIK